MKKRDIIIDGIIIFLSFIAGYYFRFFTPFFSYKGIPPFQPYLKLTIFITFGWILIFNSIDLYKEKIFSSPVIELSKIIEGSFWACIFLMAGTFLYRGFSYSRLAIGFGCVFSFVLLSLYHSLFLKKLCPERKKILIIGKSPEIEILKKRFNLHTKIRFELLFVEKKENLKEKINEFEPEFVVITKNFTDEIDFREITDKYNLKVYTIPEVSEIFFSGKVEDIDGLPLVTLTPPVINKFPNWLLKRSFDLFFGSIFLFLFCFLLPLIYLLIKIDSKGPVFFTQERIGKNGKIFKMFKFRTMKYPYLNISPFTMEKDPRLTRIGRFLRRYNIDELPQIFNVLKGDMSLVGPRPISIYDTTFTNLPEFQFRLSVKPGITGWAQIHGLRGGNYEPKERIKYDIYYIQNWSISLDFAILIYSFFAFKNAY